MIQSKSDLFFYITADRIMNGKPVKRSAKELIGDLFSCDWGGGDYQVLTCNENVCLLCEHHKERAVS